MLLGVVVVDPQVEEDDGVLGVHLFEGVQADHGLDGFLQGGSEDTEEQDSVEVVRVFLDDLETRLDLLLEDLFEVPGVRFSPLD